MKKPIAIMLGFIILAGVGAWWLRSRGPTIPAKPILVFGVDGLEWSVMQPLLKSGRLPNFEALIRRGTVGRLQTYTLKDFRTLSPVIWTTIATGKNPTKHRIRDFFHGRSGIPNWSRVRYGKAIWNITKEYSVRTHVSGWWLTWPAEEVDGYMISASSTAAQHAMNWKGSYLQGIEDQTFPASLADELHPLVDQILDSPLFVREMVFEKMLPNLQLNGSEADAAWERMEPYVQQTAASLVADEFYVRAAEVLLEKEIPRLGMVYVGGTDVASHRFWGLRTPEDFAYPVPGSDVEGLEEAIDRYYGLADAWLGDLLSHYPSDTRVFVVSDHGFITLPGAQAAPTESGATGGHPDGPAGVLIAAGPGIRQIGSFEEMIDLQGLPFIGHIEDLTPTWLTMLGVPVGEDMDGTILEWVVGHETEKPGPIESHDVGFRIPVGPRPSPDRDRAYTESLRILGYAVDAQASQRISPREIAERLVSKLESARESGDRAGLQDSLSKFLDHIDQECLKKVGEGAQIEASWILDQLREVMSNFSEVLTQENKNRIETLIRDRELSGDSEGL